MKYTGGVRGTKGQSCCQFSVIMEGRGQFRFEDGGYWGTRGKLVTSYLNYFIDSFNSLEGNINVEILLVED